MTSRTILDLDLRKILSKVERKYKVKLPRGVLAVDYGERNDFYIRFKHVEKPVGETTEDGLPNLLLRLSWRWDGGNRDSGPEPAHAGIGR